MIPDDRLPLFICTICNKKLINANSFRQQCLTTFQFLIGIYENESKVNSDDKNTTENADEPTPVNISLKFCL